MIGGVSLGLLILIFVLASILFGGCLTLLR